MLEKGEWEGAVSPAGFSQEMRGDREGTVVPRRGDIVTLLSAGRWALRLHVLHRHLIELS